MNLGNMLRQTYGAEQVFTTTFSTSVGEVLAAPNWGSQFQTYKINAPLKDSYDDVFAQAHSILCGQGKCVDGFLCFLRGHPSLSDILSESRPYRYIGVSYKKDDEVKRHYIMTSIAKHCDAHIYIHATGAVKPLIKEASSKPDRTELVPSQKSQSSHSTDNNIEIACKCGFTCGTAQALEKHLARFTGDKLHQAAV